MYFLIWYISWQLHNCGAMSEVAAILLWFEFWFHWLLASCLMDKASFSKSVSLLAKLRYEQSVFHRVAMKVNEIVWEKHTARCSAEWKYPMNVITVILWLYSNLLWYNLYTWTINSFPWEEECNKWKRMRNLRSSFSIFIYVLLLQFKQSLFKKSK